MPTFYFTFPASSPLKDAYMPVEASALQDAINKMDTMYPSGFWIMVHGTVPDPAKRSSASTLYPVDFGYMPEEL